MTGGITFCYAWEKSPTLIPGGGALCSLGYTVALNKLDGVYYVDLRPEMLVNERLREQIHDFQKFLVEDLWKLSA